MFSLMINDKCFVSVVQGVVVEIVDVKVEGKEPEVDLLCHLGVDTLATELVLFLYLIKQYLVQLLFFIVWAFC